jgi:hypothetical protein
MCLKKGLKEHNEKTQLDRGVLMLVFLRLCTGKPWLMSNGKEPLYTA